MARSGGVKAMMFFYALYNLLLYASDALVALCMASLEKMNKTKRGINERRGDKPQAQDNQSKLIQARKTLEERDRVLMAAIRRCHIELAKKESLRDIEASKDAVRRPGTSSTMPARATARA